MKLRKLVYVHLPFLGIPEKCACIYPPMTGVTSYHHPLPKKKQLNISSLSHIRYVSSRCIIIIIIIMFRSSTGGFTQLTTTNNPTIFTQKKTQHPSKTQPVLSAPKSIEEIYWRNNSEIPIQVHLPKKSHLALHLLQKTWICDLPGDELVCHGALRMGYGSQNHGNVESEKNAWPSFSKRFTILYSTSTEKQVHNFWYYVLIASEIYFCGVVLFIHEN